jgi:hypothetical protein
MRASLITEIAFGIIPATNPSRLDILRLLQVVVVRDEELGNEGDEEAEAAADSLADDGHGGRQRGREFPPGAKNRGIVRDFCVRYGHIVSSSSSSSFCFWEI